MIRRLAPLLVLLTMPVAQAQDALSDKLKSALAQTALAQVIGAEAFCNMALSQIGIEERIKQWELRSKRVAKEARRYRKYLDLVGNADKALICDEAIRQAREWKLLK